MKILKLKMSLRNWKILSEILSAIVSIMFIIGFWMNWKLTLFLFIATIIHLLGLGIRLKTKRG